VFKYFHYVDKMLRTLPSSLAFTGVMTSIALPCASRCYPTLANHEIHHEVEKKKNKTSDASAAIVTPRLQGFVRAFLLKTINKRLIPSRLSMGIPVLGLYAIQKSVRSDINHALDSSLPVEIRRLYLYASIADSTELMAQSVALTARFYPLALTTLVQTSNLTALNGFTSKLSLLSALASCAIVSYCEFNKKETSKD